MSTVVDFAHRRMSAIVAFTPRILVMSKMKACRCCATRQLGNATCSLEELALAQASLIFNTPLHILQEVSLASCVFEGDGLSACVAGSTASFRLRACDARGYTVASTTADFTLTVIIDGKEIPGDPGSSLCSRAVSSLLQVSMQRVLAPAVHMSTESLQTTFQHGAHLQCRRHREPWRGQL